MREDEIRRHLTACANDPDARRSPLSVALAPGCYEDLRRVARKLMRNQRRDHTLEPTALVHEVLARLIDRTKLEAEGEPWLRAVFTKVARGILVDHERRRRALARGGDLQRRTMAADIVGLDGDIGVLEIHDSIEVLTRRDTIGGSIAELRVFGGLATSEIASVTGIHETNVRLRWNRMKAWLKKELSRESG